VLKFPSRWRFVPPKSEAGEADFIPIGAVRDFTQLIRKTATQGDLQDFLEHFKGYFCAANGTAHYTSSNADWAETDLQRQMASAAENPPLFLEAFHDASEAIRRRPGNLIGPDVEMINGICRSHEVPYEIRGTELIRRGPLPVPVPVAEAPPTLAERAQEILQRSLRRAEDLLAEGNGREAVQETLWLLETVATGFRGTESGTGTVEGKYFNDIVKDLRRLNPGTTLDRVLKWASETHGYLSSPTGGAVRHGLDLNDGIELSPSEALLFCNLVRSYLSFLLAAHERLITARST
jgi:hypothetical protein